MLNPLNSEAGFTPYPNDQKEIDASINAGKRVLEYFPYILNRYGERGKKFTNSDTAYLVTITNGDQNYVNEELDWLGKLLSNRGMPRYLLEIHLQFLFDELVKVNPAKRAQYQKLIIAVELMNL